MLNLFIKIKVNSLLEIQFGGSKMTSIWSHDVMSHGSFRRIAKINLHGFLSYE